MINKKILNGVCACQFHTSVRKEKEILRSTAHGTPGERFSSGAGMHAGPQAVSILPPLAARRDTRERYANTDSHSRSGRRAAASAGLGTARPD
jgi:hypothetical protein